MNSYRQSVLMVLLPVFLIAFFSCDSKRFFEENQRIEKGIWDNHHKVRFVVAINDTVSAYDFFLNVRNDADYPFSNLYFFIRTILPDGKSARDTVECRLADDYGKWLGSGMGGVKFNRFFFQQGVHLRKQGNYVFEFEQAMRVKELKGIRDVGLRIEKE